MPFDTLAIYVVYLAGVAVLTDVSWSWWWHASLNSVLPRSWLEAPTLGHNGYGSGIPRNPLDTVYESRFELLWAVKALCFSRFARRWDFMTVTDIRRPERCLEDVCLEPPRPANEEPAFTIVGALLRQLHV